MHILFIGNAANPLLINLALELRRLDTGILIDILSDQPSSNKEADKVFNRIIAPDNLPRFSKIRGLKFFFLCLLIYRQLSRAEKKYDVIHIFYLSAVYGLWAGLLRSKAPKLIASVFGSEYYRSGSFVKKLQRRIIRRVDCVTAANEKTLRDLGVYYNVPETKLKLVRFGLRPLDYIKEITDLSRGVAKEKLGMPVGKSLIVCGYNASSIQQHHSIIDALEELQDEFSGQCILVFPFAMGGSDEYKSAVLKRIQALRFESRIIDKFLPDAELALLRRSADVMIQIQKTDQLSGAMQEHLFAGTLVITGAWLPYDVFISNGIYFKTIQAPEKLTDTLKDCLANLEAEQVKLTRNSEIIWRLSSWSVTGLNWQKLYA